jgi:hypothetical protein
MNKCRFVGFVFNPHSVVDVITNSSSELFVGMGDNKQEIEDLVRSIYPNYLDEYYPIKSTNDLDRYELESYLNYRFEYWSNSEQKLIQNNIPGLTKEEMLLLNKNGYYSDVVTDDEDRMNRIKEALDPDNTMFFLFSRDDNPDWDMQERLMDVMERYHLG